MHAIIHALASFARSLVRLPAVLLREYEEARRLKALRELEKLDPRMLRDIGYRASDIRVAIREGRPPSHISKKEQLAELKTWRGKRTRKAAGSAARSACSCCS